ncbi:hypothetical protein [Mangrovimonas sp. DI 80]|uniref:hypothetical protein n=1 Tax=Mangrovimonas sp. DI 80 TaxID=1779330 RepID=UPI00097823DD|nr:hypothetical protein [Mangrovimonas sp. DI 80]OMP31639.1 hypothetical protein BKM32_00775 [Mangrovimonas sp. DI 80]
MTFSELQSKINAAKPLDFGTIFNNCIELFKKVWVQGLIMILITIAMLAPFYIIMYLPMVAMGIWNPEALQDNNVNPFLMIPFVVFMLVFTFFAMVIAFGLKASFYRICKAKDLGLVEKDDYFYYLKKPYLVKVVKLALISYGISLLAAMLCVLPILYVIVPISLMNVIFAFNPELAVGDIVKSSFDLGNRKWLITFGLIVISGLFAEVIGLVLCGVGLLITASFSYLPVYYIYKDSVGFEPYELPLE